MMSDTDILQGLFKQAVCIRAVDNKITLSEPSQPESQVSICNLPDDAVCVKADMIDLRHFFADTSKGECKRADYLIFSEERKRILVIEMKKRKDAWKVICQQLHGAYCLAMYCLEVGRTFWQARGALSDYQPCFVSISHTVVGTGRQKYAGLASSLDSHVVVRKVSHPLHLQYPRLVSDNW